MSVKKSARVELNVLNKGFVTEASLVNFPVGSSTDEQNFDLNKDGSRDRRLGMDYEDSHLVQTITMTTPPAFNTYRWRNPGEVANTELLVVQVGNTLQFYKNDKDTISRNFIQSLPIDLENPSKRVHMASVGKFLVVTSGSKEIQAFTYSNAGVVSKFSYRLKIRDLFGVDDFYYTGTGTNNIVTDEYSYFRPPSMTEAHSYNLRNQSWGMIRASSTRAGFKDPIDEFNYENTNEFPNNCDTVWYGMYNKNASEEVFSGYRVKRTIDGSTAAAKGYFIIDALDRGTSRVSEYQKNQTAQGFTQFQVTSLPSDSTSGGASVCAEFASRVFYAGFSGPLINGDSKSPDLSTYILFSRLIKTTDDLGRCYQDGDPTGRGTSDIVDTDGGFIRISGAKNITNLISLNDSLVVIAENGVWVVSGGSQYGFAATNYKVEMVSNFGSIAKWSAVTDGVKVLYWSDNGISVVSKNQYGDFVWESVTATTIKRYYESLEVVDMNLVSGVYDSYENRVRWIFKEEDLFVGTKTSELILDLTIGAFYKFSVNRSVNGPEILTAFNTPSYKNSTLDDTVVVLGNPITVGGQTVTVNTSVRQDGARAVKYLAVKKESDTAYSISFALYNNTSFRDWKSVDGVGIDADAYLITGAITADDTSIHKQVPYLVMHFKRTETGFKDVLGELVPINQSSCLVRSQWDWANSVKSHKWGQDFQAYRYRMHYIPENVLDDFDTGFQMITTRNKVRGRGRAFSFHMRTEPDKDCRMVGWSLSVNGNSNV